MVNRTQYVQRSRIALDPTPYAVRISRHLSQSRASYSFWRSRNISWGTTSIMGVICWGRLALRSEDQHHLPLCCQKLSMKKCHQNNIRRNNFTIQLPQIDRAVFVARNYIFSLIWIFYGSKRDILDYWGTILHCLNPINLYLSIRYNRIINNVILFPNSPKHPVSDYNISK